MRDRVEWRQELAQRRPIALLQLAALAHNLVFRFQSLNAARHTLVGGQRKLLAGRPAVFNLVILAIRIVVVNCLSKLFFVAEIEVLIGRPIAIVSLD